MRLAKKRARVLTGVDKLNLIEALLVGLVRARDAGSPEGLKVGVTLAGEGANGNLSQV